MSQVFEIRLLPARHGDCLLLEWGVTGDTRRILIDGGPAKAYDGITACLDDLDEPRRNVELFVITHIDADHIDGAVKLLGEAPPRLRFRDVWFNGWPQIDRTLAHAPAGIARGGGVRSRTNDGGAPAARGVKEGEYVRVLLEGQGKGWNRCFDGGPVLVADDGPLPRIVLDRDLVITLLGPTPSKLEELRKKWREAAHKLGAEPGDPDYFRWRLQQDKRLRSGSSMPPPSDLPSAARLATRLDDSAANGSSIAFVAEFAGRRCALLGDAHAPTIAASFARMARERGEDKLRLDAVKLAHHGSAANITTQLLGKIDCRTFLVSTDSSLPHPHPDKAAIERILAHDPTARIVFNYRSEHTREWKDDPRNGASGYSTIYAEDERLGVTLDLMLAPGP